MKFFGETIVICILLNVVLGSSHIDPIKNLTSFKWTSHNSKNAQAVDAPIFHLFADEDHHSLALLNCEDSTALHSRACNLTIQTHSFNSTIHQTICLVDVPIEGVITSIDQIEFLKKDRVLIGWKQKYETKNRHENTVVYDWRMSYQIISTDTCKASRFIYVKTTYEESTYFHPVIAHDNDFEIVFYDKPTCHNHHYCSISHDYSGHRLDTYHKLFTTKYANESDKIMLNALYVIRSPYEDAPVLISEVYTPNTEIEKVYSPVTGWMIIRTAVHKQHIYSNSSGYATLCWSSHNLNAVLSCTWLDGSHGGETMRLVFENSFHGIPFTYNGEDGSILLVRAAGDRHENSHVVVDQGYTNGMCKRLVEAKINDIPLGFQLSIVERNTYCFSYVGKTNEIQAKSKPPAVHYTFNTRCVFAQPDENQEFFNCGNERYY